MREDKLSTQSMDFAVMIIQLVKQLKSAHESIISNQIGRSGTSIGANIREARYAHGKADFISKLQIALKEANETGYWIELLYRTDYISEDQYKSLDSACTSIRVLLISSLNTAKGTAPVKRKGDSMTTEWEKLYAAALAVAVPKVISEQMCSGGVGAAVLTENGNVYTGVCIDTDCSLGMCAERNALSTMITNGEYAAKKVIAVTKTGEILPPCGACREFMMQLGSPEDTEILVDSDTAVTLKDLMPYPY